ncbi:hypothetical protein ESCO_006525 [Escovopsis weberi]|uniref:Sterol regulatory element-binding protein 1 C-terminal domain-containing protein n=1 Tax=Escovopsis weberi TaxID=150374 RepID=A0A0M8N0F4_ESCWE|nr:hypothetical protein ESCO_006525 [Escovopsis weberi]
MQLRLAAFEKLWMGGAMNGPVRAQGIQPQYQGQSADWSNANPYVGKMMLSSLAGLMVLEAMRENEPSNSEPQVWVPRHNFFLEAAALMVKTAKLSIRRVFGDDAYRRLTGKSTLPDTPVRLMLKALHIRLLLWGFSHPGPRLGILDALASRLSRAKWKKARQLNQFLVQMGHMTGTPHEDELPDHLAALLSQECDEVLNQMVVQRAHNLAFNKETSHSIAWPIEAMDAVVEDKAVTVPMDAVAAWWSTEILHDVLAASVDRDRDDEHALDSRAQSIDVAIRVAPAGSMAHLRAILARAVLTERTRGANIAAVAQAINEGDREGADPDAPTTTGARGSGAYTRGPDSQLSLGCASALAHLKRVQAGAPGSRESFRDAVEKIIFVAKTSSLTLLSFASVMEVVDQVLAHESVANGLAYRLEELVKCLRIWMGSPLGSKCGVGHAIQEKAVNRCLTITKSLLQMDLDPGYSSMSDDEDGSDALGTTSVGPVRRFTSVHDD